MPNVLLALCAMTMALTPVVSAAQEFTSSEARKMLFREKGREVIVADVPFLGEAERAALNAYAKAFDYYGAMAVSPGDPADSGSAVALANFHSAEEAEAAALAGCEANRQTGDACVVIATVLPRRYEARGLTLSVSATAAVKGEFRKLDSPKAFAISPSTGAWGFARGDGGRALDQCNAKTRGGNDCRIAIFDN